MATFCKKYKEIPTFISKNNPPFNQCNIHANSTSTFKVSVGDLPLEKMLRPTLNLCMSADQGLT